MTNTVGDRPELQSTISSLDTIIPSGIGTVNNNTDVYDFVDEREEISNHLKQYTALLETYNGNLANNLNVKVELKKKITKISLIILSTITALFFVIVLGTFKYFTEYGYNVDIMNNNSIQLLLPIVSTITAFLATIIVIPKMIVSYIFNQKEDESMVEIIKGIQTHDVSLRNIQGNDNLRRWIIEKHNKLKPAILAMIKVFIMDTLIFL